MKRIAFAFLLLAGCSKPATDDAALSARITSLEARVAAAEKDAAAERKWAAESVQRLYNDSETTRQHIDILRAKHGLGPTERERESI